MKPSQRRMIAVDTSFVIALRGGDGADAKARAEQALEAHKDDLIVIPAPALAECLPGTMPPGLRAIDMDARSAKYASDFKGQLKKRPKGMSKREMSIDLMILATAESHGAAFIYTLDATFATVVHEHGLKIKVRGLPDRAPVQLKIPERLDAKRE